ncbi:MAG TPA: YibE/F family protein [Actinomycetota bacterium]|nr:YibE/F family protein [Actinomycetota bacterium]
MNELPHERRASSAPTLTGIAVAIAIAIILGAFLLWPTGERRPDVSQFGTFTVVFDARVESAHVGRCAGADPTSNVRCQFLVVRLLEGPDAGKRFTWEDTISVRTSRLDAGDEVVAGRPRNPQPGFEYTVVDRQRKNPLLWLGVLFAVAVLLLGRLRGAASLAGLAASISVLLAFVVPAILDGRNPVAVALVGAAAIAFLALYLSHGVNTRTTVALLGTLGGLAVTAVLAGVFQTVAQLTGFASEEATYLLASGAQVNLRGLMLGGVVIGALGAIDDITVTQTSAINELHRASPSIGRFQLMRAGMRIGRDHVASTVNTLALAYAGASMPVLLLFVLSNQSLGTVANGEVIATEIFRTLVGSIGLIASVPITTLLATRFLVSRETHGPRSQEQHRGVPEWLRSGEDAL